MLAQPPIDQPVEPEVWGRQIEELRETMQHLGGLLQNAGEALLDNRLPPCDLASLASQTTDCLDTFQALEHLLRSAAATLDRRDLIEDKVSCLADLEAAVQQLTEADALLRLSQEHRSQIAGILEHVLALRPRQLAASIPDLHLVQDLALEQRDRLLASAHTELAADLAEIASTGHPFAALLVLVDRTDPAVDVDAIERARQLVANAFTAPLAMAAVLGLIEKGPTGDSDGSLSESPRRTSAVPASGESVSASMVDLLPNSPVGQDTAPTIPPVLGSSAGVDDYPPHVSEAALLDMPLETGLPVHAPQILEPDSVGAYALSPVPLSEADTVPAGAAGTPATPPNSQPEPTPIFATGIITTVAKDLDQALAASQGAEVSLTESPPSYTNTPSNAAVDATSILMPEPARVAPTTQTAEERVDNGTRTAEMVAVWALLADGHEDLAYHLVTAAGGAGLLPQSVSRAVAVGRHLIRSDGELAVVLKQDFGNLQDWAANGGSEEGRAFPLLLAAAALIPALLAPDTGAPVILQGVEHWPPGLDAFGSLAGAIASFSTAYVPLEASLLRHARDAATWQQDLHTLQRNATAWKEQAASFGFKYQPVGVVWSTWLRSGGLVDTLIEPVLRDDATHLATVRALLIDLASDARIHEAVDNTNQQISRRANVPRIDYGGLDQITRRLGEAIQFGRRWVDLHVTRPGAETDYRQRQAVELQRSIRQHLHRSHEELDSIANDHPSQPVLASITALRRTLATLSDLFDPDRPFSAVEPTLYELLDRCLLRVPTVRFGADDAPQFAEERMLVESLVELSASPLAAWPEVFEVRCNQEDYAGATRVLDVLRQVDDEQAASLERMRQRRLAESREVLQKLIVETQLHVQQAVIQGLLTEQDRLGFTADVDSVGIRLNSIEDFVPEKMKLLGVRSTLEHMHDAHVTQVRRRLQNLPGDLPAVSSDRIEQALAAGDLATAIEFIDLSEQHQPLPEPTSDSEFERFFPELVHQLIQYLAEVRHYSVVGPKLRSRSGIPGLDLSRVSGSQADEAADGWKAWTALRELKRFSREQVTQILGFLGFSVREVRQARAGAWADVQTQPIRERERCPVPTFGSQAAGRYRLLFIWDRPNEEDLLSLVGDTAGQTPVIVFHFGRFTVERRRDLARISRERRRAFLVLDDALMLYLAAVRGSRMPVFFGCTLPFTFVEPYTITAGLVPPEMFYGRRREMDEVRNPMGTCFIYGGRQLGKTALLRAAERATHDPSANSFAYWVDLMKEDIGSKRPFSAVWDLLRGVLRRDGVLPAHSVTSQAPDRLVRDIQDWLSGDVSRRILFLVDEADNFLLADAHRNYEHLRRFKGLMDATERRFKVVFAGLHNVQRTARGENHPLAHYGEPIQIGPFVDPRDQRDARQLIRLPLAAIGDRLAEPDLDTRILARTNYYPSLIQVYCKKLLDHFNAQPIPLTAARSAPPFTISAAEVDSCYFSKDLRDEIRKRFLWTLQLDPRYELIAYVLANTSFQESDSLINGRSVDQVRADATEWWREGFATGFSDEHIRTLLDEMVGLGVLREPSSGRFALRNPNVVTLMGTQEEISSSLLEFYGGNRALPQPYDPAEFRAALPTDGESEISRRSPLTDDQDSVLRSHTNGVAVVFGSMANGLRDLAKALRTGLSGQQFHAMENVLSFSQFGEQLGSFLRDRPQGLSLCLVTERCSWDEGWVHEARVQLGRLSSLDRLARVLFVADPATAWRLTMRSPDLRDRLRQQQVDIVSLSPWCADVVRAWLGDFKSAVGEVENILRSVELETGYWPVLLERFRSLSGGKLASAEDALLRINHEVRTDSEVRADLLAGFGLTNDRPYTRVVATLAAYGEPLTPEVLTALSKPTDQPAVRSSIAWADSLRLVHLEGGNNWQADPLVRRLLTTSGND